MPGYELIGKEEQQAINRIFDENGGVLMAHGFDAIRKHYYVREFEEAIAKKTGTSKAIACTSGTSALYVALKCAGIGKGDEVIIPAFTFVATAEAVIACGAKPIVADIDTTYNIDLSDIGNLITDKVKAVIPVHMMGNPAIIREVTRQDDLVVAVNYCPHIPIIEDACQAFGAKYDNKYVGTIRDFGCYSFDGGKTITTGEGGMIVCNNNTRGKLCKQFIDHGHASNPDLYRGAETGNAPGFNFRMTELQAAIGIVQLKKLDEILARQRENKKIIKNILRQSDKITFRKITDHEGETGDTIVFYFTDKKMAGQAFLKLQQADIPTKNLPDALNWHFAGNWTWIWDRIGMKQDRMKMLNSTSHLLLIRTIALPVMVKWDEKKCIEIGEKVLKILKSL